jgi:drug/metabolite transporter (DMT)-like permease
VSIATAYLTVIVIWSTTPLAIQWSNQQVGFEFGVALRMLIGLVALMAIIRLWRLPMPWNRHSLEVYITGGLPLFVAMTSVYWSAQYIPSGWISVIFGLTPILTSLFAFLILGDRAFTPAKSLGMLLGLIGLAIVFAESFELHDQAWWGVCGVVVSATVHSVGSVLLKRLNSTISAISVTAGSLLVATPLFIAHSLWQGLPEDIPTRSLSAIVYLGIMGSAVGFPLYFYCLKNLRPQRVALIALITPITALILGQTLNGEVISLRVAWGALAIISGLALYEYGRYLSFPSIRLWARRF